MREILCSFTRETFKKNCSDGKIPRGNHTDLSSASCSINLFIVKIGQPGCADHHRYLSLNCGKDVRFCSRWMREINVHIRITQRLFYRAADFQIDLTAAKNFSKLPSRVLSRN